ncbi:MAG: SPFH domain-containing protein [Coriobacteriales bacterium]|jgi:membrane protease subunit (stomatin/prohibitin family)|nr:SPFH domain-containing protein [Coriobacteriales bacterium]
MGLLRALGGAVGGQLADQWREYFYCDALSPDTLLIKGNKRTNTQRSSNVKGSDNIITNGAVIAVNEGQCMIIVNQGKVVELCADPGEFVWDSSTEPSIFYGGLGAGIIESFKRIGYRFTFGGDTGSDQRIYFFNSKEIYGNKYGTPQPVPFRVVDTKIGLDVDVAIQCFGEYSYKIVDPIVFYTNVAANVPDSFDRSMIDSQLKSELLTALQPAFARISALGIRYSAVPAHTEELAAALNEVLDEKWHDLRGIEVASFGISSVKIPDEDQEMIKKLQSAAALRDPSLAAATLVGAQADAMRAAGENDAGAMVGFMGLGMAQAAGGSNAQQLYQMAAAQGGVGGIPDTPGAEGFSGAPAMAADGGFGVAPAAPAPAAVTPPPPPNPADLVADPAVWICPKCGREGNAGNFCSDCGTPKPGA